MIHDERTNRMLQHLIILINESMCKVKPSSLADNEFDQGRALAYHEIGGFVLESARIFNIPLTDLDIKDFNPDLLL